MVNCGKRRNSAVKPTARGDVWLGEWRPSFRLINKDLTCLAERRQRWQEEKREFFPVSAASNPQSFPQDGRITAQIYFRVIPQKLPACGRSLGSRQGPRRSGPFRGSESQETSERQELWERPAWEPRKMPAPVA